MVFPTDPRHGVGVGGFCAVFIVVLLDERSVEGRGERALFVWDLVLKTNRSDVNIADSTFKSTSIQIQIKKNFIFSQGAIEGT